MIDDRDRKLLDLLQYDSDVPLSVLAERLNLSPSACSRRITRLRDDGYIKQNSAVVDRERLNIGTTVFVMLKTSQHTSDWLERFRGGISDIPEIVELAHFHQFDNGGVRRAAVRIQANPAMGIRRGRR